MTNVGHSMLNGDIEGIERWVLGFSKKANEIGSHYMEVEYKLEGISLDKLRNIFKINMSNKDQGKLDMIDPLDIDEEQAKLLNPYVVDGKIDLDKYTFELHTFQSPGYDWSEGYAKKIE